MVTVATNPIYVAVGRSDEFATFGETESPNTVPKRARESLYKYNITKRGKELRNDEM